MTFARCSARAANMTSNSASGDIPVNRGSSSKVRKRFAKRCPAGLPGAK